MATSPPYEDANNGDLVIRTSDGGEYHIHKFLIAHISFVFADMLSVPQPHDSSMGKPVVDVTELRSVWRRILNLCYHYESDVGEPLAIVHIRDLLEAGKKYHMQVVTSHMRRTLLSPAILETHALSVYALACAYRLEDVAQ
ncbi:hypothetical protein DICSQDRAFT_65985 [Dichomitus squalens LYAD-421 SS1]|uniref:BTB domain-containing protein n=1 Tax=Dichomitus squalens (strain LYAD-421) TaxID=732165 RepID=R7SSR6_DICSQ|nr:uncharacterized protein DICSQDRAFT_65985 [Dichomitus squalens LYAD-421 SS1]EJF58998.1 hypothetical protein DICSQDRAFT_65985 [Dichomitus squalens LYAD-421 SS1]